MLYRCEKCGDVFPATYKKCPNCGKENPDVIELATCSGNIRNMKYSRAEYEQMIRDFIKHTHSYE